MPRFLHIVFLAGLTCHLSVLQAQTPALEVLSPAGGTSATGPVHIAWTLGETAIERYTGSAWQVTEGFHQPLLIIRPEARAEDIASRLQADLEVFPNPTADRVTVRRLQVAGTALELQLFTARGELVARQALSAGAETLVLDVSRLAAGTYFLHAADPSAAEAAHFTIIKTQ